MNVQKSQWTTDGENIHAYFGFSKVDKENRLVSGFATLDNVDRQKDRVLADASERAFKRFRGNIREMHDEKIAAGRMFNFKPDEFYDPESGNTYKGMYVTAYISKGAPNTWEKVLDGTLSGFSIGGKILDSTNEFSKDEGGSIRIIKDFDLFELSLVDNPANQFANVKSITKNDSGMALTGLADDLVIKNVIWCKEDKLARATTDDGGDCLFCKNTMDNIGWFEANEDDELEKVGEVVENFLKSNKELENDEGGVKMTVEKEETATEEVAVVENEPVEDLVKAEETEEEAPDLEKVLSELRESFSNSIETATTDAIEKFEGQVNDISKSFGEKVDDLDKRLTELAALVEELKGINGEVTKRLESLESETAIKKSGDLESPVVTKVTKKEDVWNGTFVSVDSM